MINGLKTVSSRLGPIVHGEFDLIEMLGILFTDEIDKAAVRGANRGDGKLVGPYPAFEALSIESDGAAQRLLIIIGAQANGAYRGPVHERIGLGEGLRFGVQGE